MKQDNKIFTSYYAKAAKLDKDKYTFCSISRGTPTWFPYKLVDRKSLAPSSYLLSKYKEGEMSWKEYEAIYIREQGLPQMADTILDDLENLVDYYNKPVVLLCYEKEQCHRFILGRFIGAEEL